MCWLSWGWNFRFAEKSTKSGRRMGEWRIVPGFLNSVADMDELQFSRSGCFTSTERLYSSRSMEVWWVSTYLEGLPLPKFELPSCMSARCWLSVCLLQRMSRISHRNIEIKASETFCCNFVKGTVSTCTGPLKSTGIYLRSKRVLNMHFQSLAFCVLIICR
jgi:hypothetical protein